MSKIKSKIYKKGQRVERVLHSLTSDKSSREKPLEVESESKQESKAKDGKSKGKS